MFGLDKVKLIMSLEDIDIINEDSFIKNVERDELTGLTFKQTEPFSLTIKIDYRDNEAVVEFTGKVLLSDYHNLIRLGNIKRCIENINALGICTIKSYMSADVAKTDITNDAHVEDVKELSDFLSSNLSSHKKYVARELNNGNFIVEKNVTSKQCKKRLTIYNKFREMYKAENRQFLEKYYNDENPFVHNNCRFELNLNSKEQIRSSLHVSDTKLKTVLLAAQAVNPIYDFLSDIIDEDATSVNKGSKVKDYYIALVLKDCDYDIKKVEARLKQYYSKGTKMRAVMKPFKKMLAEIKEYPVKCTRDTVLNLIKKDTQVTTKQILECL